MKYRGYDIQAIHDPDYPETKNWMAAIYKSGNNEYSCLWINYFPSIKEAIEAIQEWIDEQCKDGQCEDDSL